VHRSAVDPGNTLCEGTRKKILLDSLFGFPPVHAFIFSLILVKGHNKAVKEKLGLISRLSGDQVRTLIRDD